MCAVMRAQVYLELRLLKLEGTWCSSVPTFLMKEETVGGQCGKAGR